MMARRNLLPRLLASLLAWWIGAGAAMAQAGMAQAGAVVGGTSACPFADDALPPAIVLAASKKATAQHQRLMLMTMGGASTTGGGLAEVTQTYPARMQAHLARLLPGVEIVLLNRAEPNRSARSMARRLAEDVAALRPDLVIWASGGREAMRNTDLGAYAKVLEDGIAAARAAGADVVLVDTQFAPGWAAIPNIDAYRDVIRIVGELTSAPVFPRFELMRGWHETGVLNLQAADRPAQVTAAHQLFDCVGDGLARMIQRGIL